MAARWVTLAQLVAETGFAQRTLQYIRAQEPGILVTRERSGRTEYKQPDCATNLFRRERELAKRDAKPASFEDARARKMEAEAKLAEMDLKDREGKTIANELHEEVVGQVCDRIRAVLVNAPANYTLRLEQLGIEPAQAEAVLEAIALELQKALLGVGDDLDAEAAGVDDEEENEDGGGGAADPRPARG